jgi:hypothetical protein
MQMLRTNPVNETTWIEELFAAKAVQKVGIVRRAVRDVEREIGRERLVTEVRRRVFIWSNAAASSS